MDPKSDHVFTKLDASWLHMDEPTNRMIINGFFRFASPPDIKRVEVALEQGFAPFARFRQRVKDERSFLGRPRWVDDESFDISNHIERIQVLEPGDEAALRATIEGLLVQPLDPQRPLWKAYVLDGGGDGCLLFFRLHHCIGDGIALLQVLLSTCVAEEGEKPREAPRASVSKPWYWWAALPITGILYALHFLWISIWLLIRPADPETVFRGDLGVPKRTAWCNPLLLAEVKALAQAAGCKINDVLLATVSGAMRRYAKHRGRPLAPDCRLRCVVPVNLRPASKAKELGNYFAIVSPTLAVGEARPKERLVKIKRAMDALKRSPEGMVVVTVFRLLGALGVAIQSAILRLLASKTSVVVSNVPGPRSKLLFAGLRIEEIMFWVPMAGALGLGFSIFSYAGKVAIGVMSDVGLLPDPKHLADLLNHEFRDLQKAFPGAQATSEAREIGQLPVAANRLQPGEPAGMGQRAVARPRRLRDKGVNMSHNVVFIGWDRPIPGRERHAIESFQSFLGYLANQQSAGLIESFEPILLSIHGGDMNGFVIVRGEPEKLDQMKRDDRFNEEVTRANVNVSKMGVVVGYREQALQEQMARFGKLAAQ